MDRMYTAHKCDVSLVIERVTFIKMSSIGIYPEKTLALPILKSHSNKPVSLMPFYVCKSLPYLKDWIFRNLEAAEKATTSCWRGSFPISQIPLH
jgi:hypothetical protein